MKNLFLIVAVLAVFIGKSHLVPAQRYHHAKPVPSDTIKVSNGTKIQDNGTQYKLKGFEWVATDTIADINGSQHEIKVVLTFDGSINKEQIWADGAVIRQAGYMYQYECNQLIFINPDTGKVVGYKTSFVYWINEKEFHLVHMDETPPTVFRRK